MNHRSYGLSDPGRVRKTNEDSILLDPEMGLYIVSDGCGGHAAGDVASQLACQAAAERMRQGAELLRSCAERPRALKARKAAALMASAINVASAAICAAGRSDPAKRGMGCTAVALAVLGNRAIVAHAGDSRLYLVRGGHAHLLTEDHTLAGQYVRMGLITRKQARASPYATMLTRAVGRHQCVQVDTLHFELAPGDLLILCSDGLSGHLSERELASVCRQVPAPNLPAVLADLANRRGGQDNISVIAVQMEPAPPPAGRELHRRLQILHRVPLFRHLSYRELLQLMDIVRLETYEPGGRILQEGQAGDRVFVTLAGTVRVVKGGQVLTELPAGSLFGEMSLIDDSPRSADVDVSGRARVMAILRADFFALLRRERSLAVKVLWGLCRVLNARLRKTTETLSAVAKAARSPRPAAAPDSAAAPDPAGVNLARLAAALQSFP